MNSALLIASAGQTLVLLGIAWALWRISLVLRVLVNEAKLSASERERRKVNEAAEALYDAETVRAARLIVSALDTLPGCQPCKDELERIIDRRKLYPRQPTAIYPRPTSTPKGS